MLLLHSCYHECCMSPIYGSYNLLDFSIFASIIYWTLAYFYMPNKVLHNLITANFWTYKQHSCLQLVKLLFMHPIMDPWIIYGPNDRWTYGPSLGPFIIAALNAFNDCMSCSWITHFSEEAKQTSRSCAQMFGFHEIMDQISWNPRE